jgi:hypothetical protein
VTERGDKPDELFEEWEEERRQSTTHHSPYLIPYLVELAKLSCLLPT